MQTTAAGWTVIDKEAGVLSYTYSFTKGATSTCFVARLPNGKLLVVSPAVGLSDAAATELAEYGEVGAIVANNGFHHLGQQEWRERYPEARCFAAPEAMKRIKDKAPDVGDFEPLSALTELTGDDVGVREVPNTKCGESWCWAKIEGGYAWYASDVLANMPSLPKPLPLKLLFWLTKSAPGYRVFHLGLNFIVKDKKATLRLMLEDLEKRAPTVMVPAHGPAITGQDVAQKTRAVLEAAT